MRFILKIAGHPATIVGGVISGLFFGLNFREPAKLLEPFGSLYVALLSMCVLPILVTALTWGIGQMLRDKTTRRLFPRMARFYVLLLLVPLAAGLLVALFFAPGAHLGDASSAALGQQMAGQQPVTTGNPFIGLLDRIVPDNVFSALSSTEFLKIVFFSVLLGLALGVIDSPGANTTLQVLNSLYAAFARMFRWVLSVLPIGLFCIAAGNMANANHEMLVALLHYVGYFYLAGVLAILGLCLYMAMISRKMPWRVIADLKHPLIVAYATDNPLVALYSAMEALSDRFDVDRRVTDTVAPFGVIANQHGQVLLFTFTVFYLAQVYGVELGVTGIAVTAIACLISGATAFGGGAALAPIMAPILLSADIPDSLSVVVLATTQAVVAPLCSLLTVLGTAALAVITAKPLSGAHRIVEGVSAKTETVDAAKKDTMGDTVTNRSNRSGGTG